MHNMCFESRILQTRHCSISFPHDSKYQIHRVAKLKNKKKRSHGLESWFFWTYVFKLMGRQRQNTH
jgi:hypothetical protein